MFEKEPSSFRDPDGFIFYQDGDLQRAVKQSYKENYKHLMDSGLYRDLKESGEIIPHNEIESDSFYRVLEPEEIKFISYPYEWSFNQLKDAAILTLEIQEKALEYGMSLKDARTYNIQFRNGAPVLIDTLSFEKKGERPWAAYRQFCRHFLAPLALMSYKDARLLQLMKNHVDGIPLDLASKLLPRRTKLRPGILLHLHMHSKTQKYFKGKNSSESLKMSDKAVRSIIKNLKNTVRRMEFESTKKSSLNQTVKQDDARNTDMDTRILDEWFSKVSPDITWDLTPKGTSIGRKSLEDKDCVVISFEDCHMNADIFYRICRRDDIGNILPLVQDFNNPSPGLGWDNKEMKKLSDRGHADLGIALDFIPKLAISNNLPLDMIASFFGENCENLIIEFIPKSDSRVQRLLESREDIFTEYSEEVFEREFSKYYSIVEEKNIGEGKIYLMKAKD